MAPNRTIISNLATPGIHKTILQTPAKNQDDQMFKTHYSPFKEQILSHRYHHNSQILVEQSSCPAEPNSPDTPHKASMMSSEQELIPFIP